MDDTDLRAELARVTAERDALLAERACTAPLIAAARAYAKANAAVIRAASKAFARPDDTASRTPAWQKWDDARRAKLDAEDALHAAARALRTNGGSR